jgi:hypothetical protein
MKDLIFLPIEIKIDKTTFDINSPLHSTNLGLWRTRLVKSDDPEIKELTDQLPYSHITLIKYNTQAVDIPSHVDIRPSYIKDTIEYQHIKENEPSGYRVVLVGSTDRLEVFDGKEWRVARLPSSPFAYVLNSTDTKHRVIGETGRQTLYFRGFLDIEKHQQLIKKNLEKYSEYAIYRQ